MTFFKSTLPFALFALAQTSCTKPTTRAPKSVKVQLQVPQLRRPLPQNVNTKQPSANNGVALTDNGSGAVVPFHIGLKVTKGGADSEVLYADSVRGGDIALELPSGAIRFELGVLAAKLPATALVSDLCSDAKGSKNAPVDYRISEVLTEVNIDENSNDVTLSLLWGLSRN